MNRPATNATTTRRVAEVRGLIGDTESISSHGDLDGTGSHRLAGHAVAPVLEHSKTHSGGQHQCGEGCSDRPEPSGQKLRDARLQLDPLADARGQPSPKSTILRLIAELTGLISKSIEESVATHDCPRNGPQDSSSVFL